MAILNPNRSTRMGLFIRVFIHTRVHPYAYLFIRVLIHTCIYSCAYLFIRVSTRAFIHTRIHSYAYLEICVFIHTRVFGWQGKGVVVAILNPKKFEEKDGDGKEGGKKPNVGRDGKEREVPVSLPLSGGALRA